MNNNTEATSNKNLNTGENQTQINSNAADGLNVDGIQHLSSLVIRCQAA